MRKDNEVSEGQWVTPREFDAVNSRITSVENKMNDIGRDVKTLLAAYNREEGAAEERKDLFDAQRDRGARKIAWAALASGGVGALWWVQDAVAKLTHHG